MSKELKVGVFILVSSLIFLGTVVYVANLQLRGVRVPYKVYFKYAGGVEPGSAVRFGGMKSGVITDIRPSREDPTKIEVRLELHGGVPVNADCTAMLTSLSPLGDKYLEITTGSNTARRLPPGSAIPSTEPVSLDDLARRAGTLIPTVQSTLQDVQKDVDQLTSNAQLVLTNLQAVTGPQNQRNLAAFLAAARELLDKESPRIDSVLQNLDTVSSQANVALTNLGNAATEANDAFANANRTIDEIREPIKTDLGDLQRTMTEARHLITDLNTIVLANRNNLEDTLANFRAASENLRDLTESVRQRPWSLIRGKPAPDRAVPIAASAR